MIDRVIYGAPLGPIGRLADRLVIRRQLEAMFRHRHGVLHRVFG